MSASLVGSEMCIRDSVALHEELQGLVAEARHEKVLELAAECRKARSWDCLLYTSDAADDSSV
eukprot:14730159-Alexandrium_andersonii.AAC.1